MLRLAIEELWSHRVGVSIALGLSIIAVALIEAFFGPIAWVINIYEVGQLRQALPVATAKWDALNISDYDIRVDANIPFCWFEATLSVRAGAVTSIVEHEATPFKDLELCQHNTRYSEYTVAAMHTQILFALQSIDSDVDSIRATFDPTYGYVTRYRTQCYYRTQTMGDCTREIRFSNFRPLIIEAETFRR